MRRIALRQSVVSLGDERAVGFGLGHGESFPLRPRPVK